MKPGQLLCNRDRIEQALAAGEFGQTFLAVDTHLPIQPRRDGKAKLYQIQQFLDCLEGEEL
jgi:hypothetical protein